MIVVAANAGGAWSPIGDVTTTMLWIGKRVTAEALFVNLLLPSAVCMVIPVFIASLLPAFKGDFKAPEGNIVGGKHSVKMLCLGLGGIIFVPIFKTLTHLPPYVGMMLSLGIIAIVAEIITAREFSFSEMEDDSHPHSPVHTALSRIEMPSLLFFFGILMSVAALESLGQLFMLAQSVQNAIPNLDIVVMLIGAGSAVVDNVPLVAASMGMFQEPENHPLWHFIAFSAGTGGSMLIIGSAAGVVAMGMEKISFFWYFKNIAWLALIGFVAGSMTFLGMKSADLIITNEEEAVVEQVEEIKNSTLLTAL
jgi:Na+/H+ antiporter NhaD/arsenite permease-like protein